MSQDDRPLDVWFTVDVEVWCDGWDDVRGRFPEAFRRYVYGPTARGDYALPHLIRVLNDHGLQGNFFVEPLFAGCVGEAPLAEIVGLLRDGRQDVQLHLHTEWVDEAARPWVPMPGGKRQHLRQYDADEQRTLIGAGLALLRRAGADGVTAFRAGGFAFDHRTLPALRHHGIAVDASYNASMSGPDSGVAPGELLADATDVGGVRELPMTVFVDGTRRLRHAQLTACSAAEMESLLWQARRGGQRAFVILAHNFELLTPRKDRADDVVVARFHRLCRFLDRHRDEFRVRRLSEHRPQAAPVQPQPLRSGAWRTAWRIGEQAWRRART